MSGLQALHLDGIDFTWAFGKAHLFVEVFAPTQGWVAVGFNTRDGLAGTNLIMGTVTPDGQVTVQDRYIIQAGQHESKPMLNARDRLYGQSGEQDERGTTIRFTIPIMASDAYSYSLIQGRAYHLLLAYSVDDDFMHHSRVRSQTTVTL